MRTLALIAALLAGTSSAGEWQRLASLPDPEGFAGSFAGVSQGALLVAGGANFPDKKPWQGGQKVWTDVVFVLDKPGGKWKSAGKLPRALGYGVSVTHRDSVVCVGGSDAKQHYRDAFRLTWKDGKLTTTKLPALPKPLANGCGAVVGDVLYVAGGQEKPDARIASKAVWQIDLAAREPKWESIEACPGEGRILAVAAGFDGAFWLMGGAALVENGDSVSRKYRSDAYRYDPGKGWKRLADLPHPVVAAPSPAPTDSTGFFVLGGDDGKQVGAPHDKHRGFRKSILRYDVKTAKWAEVGELVAPRVTVACVVWNGDWVVPSGEVRPGVRSPEVWRYAPGRKR